MAKKEAGSIQLLRTMGIGGLIAEALTMLLCMLLASLASSQVIPEELLLMMSAPIALVSTLLGGCIAVRSAGQKRLPIALGTGAIYLLLGLSVRSLWFNGAWSALPAIAAAVGALGAGLISSRRKKRRK